jgi:hypothetical protein
LHRQAAQHKVAFEKAVKDAVAAAKKARKEKKEKKQKELEAIPKDVRTALQNIRIHKFYPKSESLSAICLRYLFEIRCYVITMLMWTSS